MILENLKKITPEEISPTLHTGKEDSPELGTEGMQELFDAHPNLNTETINTNAQIQNENNDIVQSHMDNTENPHKITKTQVGLGNADNTSDMDKPISTKQRIALGLKADRANTYTKLEVDEGLQSKADRENTYTKVEVDSKDTEIFLNSQQDTAKQIANTLDNTIYGVPYYDPVDGKRKPLQDILYAIFDYQTPSYNWAELEQKSLSWQAFELLELTYKEINEGGW